ncbi:MAG: heavy metal translocating P-type ATPase, partial [Longimicrobiales bacterium]
MRQREVELTGSARRTLRVSGMDCSSCAATVEKALRSLDGVEDVQVDVMGGRVDVAYAAGPVAHGDFARAIERAGYRIEKDTAPTRRAPARAEPTRWAQWAQWAQQGRLALAVLAGVFWAASLIAAHLLGRESAAAFLAIGALVAGGWYIVPRGIRAALRGTLDMNALMSMAAVGALLIGEYEEAATALFLFAVAQLLESYSMDRARNAVRALMDLSPAEATVLRDGREERVPADRVMVGAIVLVRPGEKISVDGDVTAGRSAVDQAPITGESVPVEKERGDEVFAGTLNGAGALEVRSTRHASDTTLARIIHSVADAQASRAPSQTFVDRFARVYTPIVVAAALAVFLLPPLLGFGAWSVWFYRALVLLVVACPCALVISTPVTVVSALAGSVRRGILIKGGLHLENAGRATIVALDKTGTLTEGTPEVVEVAALDGATDSEV